MSDNDYPDTKLSLGGWMMVLAGVPVFLGFEAPDFSLPEATWIGDAVQIGFFVAAALMFLAGLGIWLYQKSKGDQAQKPTDGPEAS